MQFIKNHSEYVNIQKNCNRFFTKYFIVLYQKKNLQDTEFRLGITVSKKVGNAVIRNKIKRRIKSYFRQRKNMVVDNINFILIAKKNSSDVRWLDFQNDLDIIVKKLEII